MEVKIYLHSNKEDIFNQLTDQDIPKEVAQDMRYMCYEVEVTAELNEEERSAYATHFGGVKLEKPVRIA